MFSDGTVLEIELSNFGKDIPLNKVVPDHINYFNIIFNFMNTITQREKYSLQFMWAEMPYIGLTAIVENLRDKDNMPIGGGLSYYLAEIINRYNIHSLTEDLLTDIENDIIYKDNINDSYDIGDATYIATHNGDLIVGDGPSYINPLNFTIPLTDFRDLLIEWNSFLKTKYIV